MIQIIHGEKGTGKTKKIIAMANSVSESIKGSTVFMDDDTSYMYDLGYSIRFVNVTEFDMDAPDLFLGFIAGMAASDYDLEYIFVDRFLKIIGKPLEELEGFFARLDRFTAAHKLIVVLSVSESEEQLPAFMRPYLVA